MQNTNILSVLKPFITVLDNLSIPYYIGGSIASSVFGLPRSTLDIDIIADIQSAHIPELKAQLEKIYYIDEDMIHDAIERVSSFNLIHLETAMKIDVFIPPKDNYHNTAENRKKRDILIEHDKSSEFYFASPEDIILNKLKWYKMGNQVSEKQWLDVIGVINVQADFLDREYLKSWSKMVKRY